MDQKPPLTLRKFKTEDIAKVLRIEAEAFPKTAYSKSTFRSYAKSLPDGFVVLEVGTDVAGYIIFDTAGHIHSTAVKPLYRRRGFATMLFKHAVTATQRRLWLEVRSTNQAAIGFYLKMGMQAVGRIPNYYGNDDALIMVLDEET